MCYSEFPSESRAASLLRSIAEMPILNEQLGRELQQLMKRCSMPKEVLDATQQGSFTFRNTAVRVMDAGQSARAL